MTWTPLAFLRPHRHLADGVFWDAFDLERWSRDFRWERDDWNGLRDTVTPPMETVNTRRGDCDDFAFVAASWALANGRDGAGLAVCWADRPWPTHMVAFDSERVYSSGSIREKGLAEWVADSRYRATFTRPLR